MMELIGDQTRAWAKDRWDELLAKLPDMSTDRTDALISALGGIATGMEAIAGFLPKRPPNGAEELIRDLATRNLTGEAWSDARAERVLILQSLAVEFLKEGPD